MSTVSQDQTTTLVADTAGEYIINAEIETPGLAIDASGAIPGRSFFVNGTVYAMADTAMVLGDASLADSDSYVKIGDSGTFRSGGAGLVAASGGVTFENVGMFKTVSTGVELDGSGNVFKNVSSENGPGKMISTAGSVLVSFGDRDTIDNTGAGVIRAQLDAIVSHGKRTSITNDGTAEIISLGGSAIVASGKRDVIYSVSDITAENDAVVASGARTKITNAGDSTITSNTGRGIVSTGGIATVTNQATISSGGDGIFSSGANANIDNDATITSSNAAAIRSTGDGATVTNSTTATGKTFGILSTGNDATITNFGDVSAKKVGIRISGNDAELVTQSHVTAATALSITGNDADVTIQNVLTGTGKSTATIDITGRGHTTIVNEGAVSTASGTVLDAGSGAERITNTGSLYGVVNLGGGNDIFKSIKGEVTGAVNGGGGNDRITNTGLMQFDVNLGAGNDVFKSLKGEVDGKVYGGSGNDTYITGIDLDIREKANGGTDTVESKYTYTLGANIENLLLLGKGTMDATGNKLANRIEGNAGNNHLTGGGGNDVFVFETGCRKDIVTDFTDHADRIDLSGYKGIDRFSDLKGDITQAGDDVAIELHGKDVITLDHMRVSHLSAADFIF